MRSCFLGQGFLLPAPCTPSVQLPLDKSADSWVISGEEGAREAGSAIGPPPRVTAPYSVTIPDNASKTTIDAKPISTRPGECPVALAERNLNATTRSRGEGANDPAGRN